MKYTYAYKTADGARHEETMEAASREAAFETLRARGIRPIKVAACDGSKANGEESPAARRARTVRRLAAAAAAAAAALFIFHAAKNAPAAEDGSNAKATARHQIYGDPAIVSAFERGEFAGALPRSGDRMLAIFAQPGRLMFHKGTDPRRPTQEEMRIFTQYAAEELGEGEDVAITGGDSREERELKQIVNGMRAELREYLANGNGTPRSYWRRLNERTTREMLIYERTKRELENETDEAVRERKNEALRRLGLLTVPGGDE